MLINKLRDMYREITGNIEPAMPITLVMSPRPAANADNIRESSMQARRQRRHRRTEGSGLRNTGGWSVRSW